MPSRACAQASTDCDCAAPSETGLRGNSVAPTVNTGGPTRRRLRNDWLTDHDHGIFPVHRPNIRAHTTPVGRAVSLPWNTPHLYESRAKTESSRDESAAGRIASPDRPRPRLVNTGLTAFGEARRIR